MTIYAPESGGVTQVHLYLVAAPDKGGGIITQRTFDRLRFYNERERVLVSVGPTKDLLGPLDGKTIDQRLPNAHQSGEPIPPFRVARVADAGNLPDRAAGYDAAEVVCLNVDVSPAAFSDAQTDALRGYVAGGGLLLVVEGAKLRADERFRVWFPPPGDAGLRNGVRAVGRGRVLTFDNYSAQQSLAHAPEPLLFWKRLFDREMSPPSIGRIAARDEGFGYENFSNSVLHVPGLAAPGVGTIAGFLTLYLFLLVPLNYFILKRLDRREWAWITVPALAALFSVGAYSFSYANKGRLVAVNVASIAEMGAGSGATLIHSAIGVFSPSRARYDVAVDLPDAVILQPSQEYGGGAEGGFPLIIEREAGGATAKEVAVPMWGMNVVSTQTVSVKMGDGVIIQSQRKGDRLWGTIANRTGRALNNVVIRLADNGKRLGNLAAGQSVPFDFTMGKGDHLAQETGLESDPADSAKSSPTLTRRQIAADLSRAVLEGFGSDRPTSRLVLSAWTYDRLLPVQIDGKSVSPAITCPLSLSLRPSRNKYKGIG